MSATTLTQSLGDVTDSSGVKKVLGKADKGVSLSFAVGVYDNQTEAYLAGNATVNARGAIDVTADTLNAFDPSQAFGANLVAPFSSVNTRPKYTTADGTQTLKAGDVVGLAIGYKGGGDAGTTYKYIGPDGAALDLVAENYRDPLKWEPVNLAAVAGLGFFRTLTTYLGNNFGLDNNLADSWSQSAAVGQTEATVAGSFTVLVLNHKAQATIRDGAAVNQDPAYRSGGQAVSVLATSQNDAIHIAGNFQTLNLADLAGGSMDYHTWTKDKKSWKKVVQARVRGEESESAVGVTVLVAQYSDNVQGGSKTACGCTRTACRSTPPTACWPSPRAPPAASPRILASMAWCCTRASTTRRSRRSAAGRPCRWEASRCGTPPGRAGEPAWSWKRPTPATWFPWPARWPFPGRSGSAPR